jgi:hypothetical protein
MDTNREHKELLQFIIATLKVCDLIGFNHGLVPYALKSIRVTREATLRIVFPSGCMIHLTGTIT